MEQPDPIYLQDVSIDQLIPDPENPRLHSDHQIDLVIESIKNAGFTNPPLIDENFMIIAGHGRLMALQKMGRTTVSCLQSHGLTKAQKNALNIADNSLPLMATWSPELLKVKIESLQEDGYNTKLLGFEDNYLKTILNPEQIPEAGLTDEDAVPEVRPDPITKLGDVWILGNHRLMCGDSTSVDDVDKLMNGNMANLVMTDPPYSIETEGGCNGAIGKNLKKQGKAIDFISDFNPDMFLNTLPTLFKKNTLNAYIFCNKELLPDYLLWARDNKISFNVLVWKKPNALPIGGSHKPDIEYLLLFRKSATWNGALKGVNYSRLIECGRENGLHPTMKPVSILTNQILISSDPSDIVVDLFGGSGSTLIACQKTDRICHMIEILPQYCDVIVKRWQEFTGNEATLESTGQPFKVLGENNG